MKQLGGALFFFGIGSAVLYFLEMQFVILSWIDNWGETNAWIIRGAMAVIGGVLWMAGNKKEAEAAEA